MRTSKKEKRLIAFLLAIAMTFSPILQQLPNLLGISFPMIANAGNVRIVNSSGNLLDGQAFDFYGHGGRTGIWYWKTSDGYPAYCIQPTKAMQGGAGMNLDRYSLEDWPTSELDMEQRELIFYAMAACGASSTNKNTSTANYILVQSAIWAITSGEWTTVEDFRDSMSVITSHIRNNQAAISAEIMAKIDNYVDTVNTFVGNDSKYIPKFASKHEKDAPNHEIPEATIGSGVYEREFDVNDATKNFKFQIDGNDLPYAGWSYEYISDTKVKFTYDSYIGTNPFPLIMGIPREGSGLASMIGIGNIGVLLPDSSNNQEMVLGVEAGTWVCYARLETTNKPEYPDTEGGSFEIESHRYEHEETFKSNYKIELNKADAETGKELADTTFSVLEMFDSSQLSRTNLERSQFSREPSVLTEHEQITTDDNGYASHSDQKNYLYEKTYCYGHPDPVINYIPYLEDDGGEDEGESDAIADRNAEIDELNRQLEEAAWAAWQAEVDDCEGDVDFHSIEIGEAEEEMESDRNSAFRYFINLKYAYTVEEVAARNGYILHDYHIDDDLVPVIEVASSQAGGTGEIIGHYYRGEFIPLAGESAYSFDGFDIPSASNDSTGWSGTYEESEVRPINQNSYSKTNIGFIFNLLNHRTEGEIHFNKRDLYLHQEDAENSYGQTQGDGTLEGAVYGLYAAENIEHPDGKTGSVFLAGELVAITSTDINGDAAFTIITENSKTSDALTNLYSGGSLYGRDYPDYLSMNGGTWIGRPLLLGSYYIEEIARSEGYELSQYGINLSESNRTGNGQILAESGSASAGALSHPINGWDGSWNDFTVKYYRTENGFDIYLTGYPAGSSFYQVETIYEDASYEVVIDEYEEIMRDDQGNILYLIADEGEYKYGSDGNLVPATDDDGNPLYDTSRPLTETVNVTSRLNYYPDRDIATGSNAAYLDPIDGDFILAEMEDLLSLLKYKAPGGEAPVKKVSLTQANMTNVDLIEVILSELLSDTFWDSYGILDVYQDDVDPDTWHAIIAYDYVALSNVTNFYDAASDRVILKRDVTYASGSALSEGYTYIIFSAGDFTKSGSRVTIAGFEVDEAVYGEAYAVSPIYAPLYETYEAGEQILDSNGNPIPLTETVYVYGMETVTEEREVLTQLTDVTFDSTTGTYTIHIENDVDWDVVMDYLYMTIRAMAPDTEYEGMPYADYILQKGATVNAFSVKPELVEGTYIKYVNLLYPGQLVDYQDAGTRMEPIIVLQRVIKQAVRVIKDISLSSYDQVNTYSIHRDPYTVLYGGYGGMLPAKAFPGFSFKIYLTSDLVETGRLHQAEDGSWDYKSFFDNVENEPYFESLAVAWDKSEEDVDDDLTTIHANIKGNENYYGDSLPLPYGTYVIVEQQPRTIPLKHYQKDDPKEIVLPYVPHIDSAGNIHEDIPSREYLYDSQMTAEDMNERYGIRFIEEGHVIKVFNKELELDHEIYKYGLSKRYLPAYETPYLSHAENAGTRPSVYYQTYVDREGNIVDYGLTLYDVPTMTGKSTAVDRVYSHALVPWSVLPPVYGGIINDDGDIGNRDTGLEEDGSFNWIAFAKTGFENQFFKSWLRIEKIDGETKENIIHAGAKFKIYAAKRDVTGTETGVEGTGNVIFDKDGIPVYDEEDLITMLDETGTEIGIFEAFSTEVEVVKEDGTIEKQVVGFIALPQPLGAGVYVLVESEAPPGYLKSKPIAFEVYSDEVTYYHDGNPDDRRVAVQYTYAMVGTDTEKLVSQIFVEDKPSKVAIHKVEDGEEAITFKVFGPKALLESRGDVTDITYDAVNKIWWGMVTKKYDTWSENLVYGTEAELRAMDNMKLVYDKDGNFLGYGIRFDIYVSDAELTVYEGLEVRQIADGYEGVTVYRDTDGKVTEITATKTGTHKEIQKVGKDSTPTQNDVWDAVEVDNPPASLLFYDLAATPHEVDPGSGRTYILNERGMRTCMADPDSGMAYVLDDYGHIITYPLNEAGDKTVSQSIKVYLDEDGKPYIYNGIQTVDDENGLPKYYLDGRITLQDDIWTTSLIKHVIERLPFGAYVLEETKVPYDQGYIQSRYIGFILEETDEEQRFFLENDFTKTEYAKVDIRTKEEIPDAEMALWLAVKVEDDSDKGFHLEYALHESGKRISIRNWISGYLYDDAGNRVLDGEGKPIVNTKPYWVDHLPVGYYILEEVRVPHHYGYVQSSPLEIIVEETGFVQTFVMEDDFTSIEVVKMDDYKKELLVDAEMGFYKALLDGDGNPVLDEAGIPATAERLFSWMTEDGRAVAATAHPMLDSDTGEQVFDEEGEPVIAYDYDIYPINGTLRGRYYLTEEGALRMEYLPIGYYVLIEEQPPTGIATADPILIEVREVGSQVEVQYNQMDDQPLTVELYKLNTAEDGTTRKVIIGAVMRIYETNEFGVFEKIQARDEDGNPLYETDEEGEWILDGEGKPIPVMEYDPLKLKYQFITGRDGVYEEGDTIPDGFEVGDLRPHTIRYIPIGNYVLIEHRTPYGFLTSNPIYFSIVDTEDIQVVEMEDVIPEGFVEIEKLDEFTGERLPGAEFVLRNKTLDKELEVLTTDESGTAISERYPIGYVRDGRFHHYTYTIQERSAPDDYMLNEYTYQFQFPYEGGDTVVISHHYQALNEPNQVIISKKLIAGVEELPGAYLELYRILKEVILNEDGEEIGEREWEELYEDWISTETPHYITNIPSGRYILRETQAPGDGYAIAEEIYFEIEDNMVHIPEVTMYDDHTKTEIHKVPTGSTKLLGGAKFQLADEAGNILDEFTTVAGEPYAINGLAPGRYTLTELEAPAGYQKLTLPITIEVTDTYEVQVFRVENKATGGGSGGGGGGNSSKPYIQKVDKETYVGLGNAWIIIYNPDGSVYAKGQTDANGRFYFKTPPAGTYTFQELAAPDGYFLNENRYSFTVDSSGNIVGDTTIENSKRPEIPVYKVDGMDGGFIPGAAIEFYNSNGHTVFRSTTDEHGSIRFVPTAPGIYTFKEVEAPKGYVLSEDTYLLTVYPDGSFSGDGVVINYPTVGKVTASYDKNREGYGGTDGISGIPKTGDSYLKLAIWLCALSISLSAVYFTKKRRKNVKSLFLFMTICSSCLLFTSMEVRAEDGLRLEEEYIMTEGQEEGGPVFDEIIEVDGITYTLTGTYEEVLEEREVEAWEDVFDIPQELVFELIDEEALVTTYTKDGIPYYLKSFAYETVLVQDRYMEADTTVEYTAIEAAEGIPLSIQTTITDVDTRRKENVTLPLKEYHFNSHRWDEGFSFTITFEMYGSSYYLLGDGYIPYTEDVPALKGYEGALLEHIRVSGDNYRILGYEWMGEAYIRDGITYRNARAYGERLVVDCMAEYGGQISLPDAEGYIYTLTYSSLHPDEAAIHTERTMKAVGVYEPLEKESSWWDSIPVAAILTSVAIILALLFMVMTFYIISKKKKGAGVDEKQKA